MTNSTLYHFLSYYPLVCVLFCGYALVVCGVSFIKGLANLMNQYLGNDTFRFHYFLKFLLAGAVVGRYYSIYCDKDSTLALILADPFQATLSMAFSLFLPVAFLLAADFILYRVGPPEMAAPESEGEPLLEKLKDMVDDLIKPKTLEALKQFSKRKNQHIALVIENQKSFRRLIKRSLEKDHFNVIEAEDGAKGLSLASALYPDLIILDSELPDMDGLLALHRLREWTLVPMIVLTDRATEKSEKTTGEDYYLTRHFKENELTELIQVVLRHVHHINQRGDTSIYQNSDFKLDRATRTLTVRRKETHLTPHQYHVLSFLISHAGRVVTKKMVNSEFWGRHMDEESLARYIHQLRQKIEYDPVEPRYILNEPGDGYRLEH